ncbi:glycosyl hydrolase family 10 [Algibacter amylolyticus]|uniref:Beta-xylanase n=1 Tax=Algibacter amylolyticus TaxID=1608400 RepID=A0A5M7BFL5_9FLAO|nr:endo-1,4-beta-xylanase [Algibacter amylolyticus]KAA5826424.1 glycosyl hydrolase family 10 [Algibacter amylolyticus]MBB5268633.1 endo-1,4-beta-xylanase [Algibacter amylolyticus]TSJ80462.1 glycosyl hydrolase family 10 [Algibacter amylolyticus]
MSFNNVLKISVLTLVMLVMHACNKNKTIQDKGLKDHAEFPIGTAIKIGSLTSDLELQELQKSNFNSITSTSDMKMNRILLEDGNYNWSRVDKIVDYAQTNNQRLFGHNLIWHSSTPKWVEEKAGKDSLWLEGFMKDYISTYAGRYKGKVAGWDVVNEAFESAGGAMRETVWYNVLGEDYIAKAFTYAHAADPNAVLFYNDFNIERDTLKLNATLKLVKDLKEKGVPIHGIGFQMHIRMDIPDETIAYALKKAADTGLQIHLSEVDIIFNKHNDTRLGGVQIFDEITDEMKTAQAEKYKNLVSMYRNIVPKAQQFGITFWEFNDRDTWINGFFNLKDWPTIYNEKLEPKPAYFGFLEGLKEEL